MIAGYARALAIIEPTTHEVTETIGLSGHPEAFAIERAGHRVFVNVPSARHIAVVDLEAGIVSATWDVGRLSQNFPMALDEDGQRLFVVTRSPAMLLVINTGNGQRVAELPTCGDSDDLFFDRARKQFYVVCGEGFVDVVRQEDVDHYQRTARTVTAVGARTDFFSPERSTLYVGAPARSGGQAEIRVIRVR